MELFNTYMAITEYCLFLLLLCWHMHSAVHSLTALHPVPQESVVSHYRVLFWVVKLKPLFDAYTGPYKDKFYFWTGFLLVIRITLFIAIASNTTKGPILNLSLVCVTAAILLLLCQAGVYKAWPVSIIESFTYFNLIIFSMGMAYVLQLTSKLTISHHKDRAVILCVGSMFLLFCGIVAYTIVRMLASTVWWGRTKLWLQEKQWLFKKRKQIRPLIIQHSFTDSTSSSSEDEMDPILQNAPPVARYDQLRELSLKLAE